MSTNVSPDQKATFFNGGGRKCHATLPLNRFYNDAYYRGHSLFGLSLTLHYIGIYSQRRHTIMRSFQSLMIMIMVQGNKHQLYCGNWSYLYIWHTLKEVLIKRMSNNNIQTLLSSFVRKVECKMF